jgi:D-amino-acid dehydrogenase
MKKSFDVAVIGAGIVGVATALHLLMRGKTVLLLDRQGIGRETSYGNAGLIEASCILPYGFPPLSRLPNILFDRDSMARVDLSHLPKLLPWLVTYYLNSQNKARKKYGELLWPLVSQALDEHRVLMRDTDAESHLFTMGRVALYRNESTFASSEFERVIAIERGVPFDVMDSAAFGEIEPHLIPTYHKVIRWQSSARLNNPAAVIADYGKRFITSGGIFTRATVKNLESSTDGWCLNTDTDSYKAQNIVVCAGPWSMDILKPLGYRFPLIFKRGYHQHFAARHAATLSHAIVDVQHGYVIAPMEQGYRLTTGAEFTARDAPANPVQIAHALPLARELFPLGEAIDHSPWLGSRPCFSDSLPILGRAPRHEGLWLNFGHGHLGLTIGPSSARLLAEMMTNSQRFCDPYPYRAERFNC